MVAFLERDAPVRIAARGILPTGAAIAGGGARLPVGGRDYVRSRTTHRQAGRTTRVRVRHPFRHVTVTIGVAVAELDEMEIGHDLSTNRFDSTASVVRGAVGTA